MAGGGSGGAERRRRGQAGCGVAVDEAAVAGREGRQRSAIGFGLAVGGDGQADRGYGQGAGYVADAVVAVYRTAGGNAVGVARDMAGSGGAERRWAGQAGCGVAVDEAAVAGREGRQRGTIGFGLAVGGDGQADRGYGEGAGYVADAVVAVYRTAGGDAVGVARDMAGGGGGGAGRRRSGQAGCGV